MKKIEKFFDINMVLMTIFSALESIREEGDIELVYDIDATIPKELKGDVESVTHLLTQLLQFVFLNTQSHEVIFSLRAPDDFLYEEFITFEIDETDISREKAISFFEARLKPLLEKVEGKATYDDETGKISIAIPFKLKDLGNRRYYRLPDIGMLGKKVLLICKSKIVAESLRKMFKYFLYEVDVGAEEYKNRGGNLAHYDIFVLEDSLLTDGIKELVQTVQEKSDLKFVILEDAAKAKDMHQKFISAYLIKPVMQESIFELIITLYSDSIKDRMIKKAVDKPIINMEKYLDDAFRKSEESYLKMEEFSEKLRPRDPHAILDPLAEEKEKEDAKLPVLDTELGETRSKEQGMDYIKALEQFVETFTRSDYYFREIVNTRSTWQIKEFAIDLEKYSKQIGAKRMERLAERISLLFVYDNLSMLPVYAEKYHLELKRVLMEISNYLKKHKK
jgi:hypothetical protein